MKNKRIDIANLIYSSPASVGEMDFCLPQTINSFFENIPEDVLELWPFDFQKEGYKTAFTKVAYNLKANCMALQEKHTLSISGICYNNKELYVFDSDYSMNEEQQLCFELKSLYKEKGLNKRNFANIFIKKHQKFLFAYDKCRSMEYDEKYSEIKLLAASGHDVSGIPVNGGYIWAFMGMDFYNLFELEKCRKSFAIFFKDITGSEISKSDLKQLKKPCHFAMFDNGVKIKSSSSQNISVGNAFMHQYSWVARWNTKNPQSEEKKFATIFNAQNQSPQARLNNAFTVLNNSYKIILKKYYLKSVLAHKWKASKNWGILFKNNFLTLHSLKKIRN